MNQSLFLFDDNGQTNLLPEGGELYEYPNFLSSIEHSVLCSELMSLPWQEDCIKTSAGVFVSLRKVILMGEEGLVYRYSGVTRHAGPWYESVFLLKEKLTQVLDIPFNSCLLNYYPTGHAGMGWHSDDEPQLGIDPKIAVLSLGASRRFSLKHKTKILTRHIDLAAGSLILMQGGMQRHWLHAIPKTVTQHGARVSLTFRYLYS